MTDRKFTKTVIAIEVISDEPIPDGMELTSIINNCIYGNWSMRPLKHEATTVNGKQAAAILIRQASDPSFFNLDAKGNDL